MSQRKSACPDPDFLSSMLALANFMRLSVMKAAHAAMSSAASRKSGGWGQAPNSLFADAFDEGL